MEINKKNIPIRKKCKNIKYFFNPKSYKVEAIAL